MADIEAAATRYAKRNGYSELKPQQVEILETILNGKDCFVMLPTGFGKSLPHQMYLQVKKLVNGDAEIREHVLVISPLVSLMEDQVRRISGLTDVTSAFRGKDPETDQRIEDGHYDIIYASPETLVDNDWVRKLVNVRLLVVDECHTVSTWGGLDDENTAFRKSFRHIVSLRSLFPEAAMLALCGTCTLKMKNAIMDTLSMKSARVIELSPNRENIKLLVVHAKPQLEETFFWIVDKFPELKSNFPRTIIYSNSIQDVSKIYNYLTHELGAFSTMIEMYHSETPGDKKADIVKNLGTSSDLRIVIATSALGMGIDVYQCHNIVLYGPPKEIVDLLQETGRCGRDGAPSLAIIFCNRYQLSHLSSEVKNFIKSNECRRKQILSHFSVDDFHCSKLHSCCDVCAKKCVCGDCDELLFEKYLNFKTPCVDELSSSSSDSDTISYEYESEIESF